MREYDESDIKKELKIHARAVGIPSGAAELFIDRAVKDARKSLKGRSIITESDLKRALVKELKKYHPDFAYVYQFHDKII
ncbi:hypothetical protein IKF87_00150 [Candidatus Saccharibacteria bacterium]|nr:hypothetical protein [Candidatus Saccharibacteria bacterium]